MKFIRKYSNNIIKDDSYSHRKDNYDELVPEVFDNVSEIKIHTDSYMYKLDEMDVESVIESFNYFTIVYKQTRPTVLLEQIIMIKYSDVNKIEFLNSTIKEKESTSLDIVLDNFWKKGKLCD